jgi:hypothetical protein
MGVDGKGVPVSNIRSAQLCHEKPCNVILTPTSKLTSALSRLSSSCPAWSQHKSLPFSKILATAFFQTIMLSKPSCPMRKKAFKTKLDTNDPV